MNHTECEEDPDAHITAIKAPLQITPTRVKERWDELCSEAAWIDLSIVLHATTASVQSNGIKQLLPIVKRPATVKPPAMSLCWLPASVPQVRLVAMASLVSHGLCSISTQTIKLAIKFMQNQIHLSWIDVSHILKV